MLMCYAVNRFETLLYQRIVFNKISDASGRDRIWARPDKF